MPIASLDLLLVLYIVQAQIEMLFRVICYFEYFIIELFIEEPQYISFVVLGISC